jgi:hypothetical protein
MGKGLLELHQAGPLSAAKGAAKSTPDLGKAALQGPSDGVVLPKALTRRYTFSVLPIDPVSPKTPALVSEGWESPAREGHRTDLVVSVPAMLDMSFITLQGRMDPVQAAIREDPDAFDPIEHRMEYDMLNSVFKTVANIAYHLNKLVRSLAKNDDKYNRPEDGVDGLDIISGLRGAISRSQEASKRLAQLVKNHKNMYGTQTTREVLGDEGIVILEQIEGAMAIALTKSARLVDAMEAAKRSRAKVLMQKAAAALFQVQGDQGSTSAILRVHFVAWKDALNTIKEERAAEGGAAAA